MKKQQSPPTLLTLGRIAIELNQPVHRVAYRLNKRPRFEPKAFAARVRLYDWATVEILRQEFYGNDLPIRREGRADAK